MNKAAIYICVLIYSPMERGKDDVTHIKGSHFMNGSMNGFTSSNFPWMKKKRVCIQVQGFRKTLWNTPTLLT